MKKLETFVITIAILTIILSIAVVLKSNGIRPLGQAVPGSHADIATSSTKSVGPQAVTTLFTSNIVCTSRIISTVSQPIMLSFDPNITPTATRGHLQAASTTEMYDAGLYGCGAVTVYGHNASTTITSSELR